jgi:hypothetical protein
MKISYVVSYEGTLEVPTSDWEELKEEYNHDVKDFAFVTVQEELGAYQGLVIIKVEK